MNGRRAPGSAQQGFPARGNLQTIQASPIRLRHVTALTTPPSARRGQTVHTNEVGSGDLPQLIGVGCRGRAAVWPSSFLHAKSRQLLAKLTVVSWRKHAHRVNSFEGTPGPRQQQRSSRTVLSELIAVFVLVQVSRGSCKTATLKAGSSNAMHARHMV